MHNTTVYDTLHYDQPNSLPKKLQYGENFTAFKPWTPLVVAQHKGDFRAYNGYILGKEREVIRAETVYIIKETWANKSTGLR
jgi:hypothetical protein